jgi:hypothetical protein
MQVLRLVPARRDSLRMTSDFVAQDDRDFGRAKRVPEIEEF